MQTETTRYRILAIDDEASVHETYQAILGSNNQDFDDGLMELVGLTEVEEVDESPSFILDSAYSGEEGLQCVIKSERQGAPYAVVFLDMRMPPGWDGLKTAEKIREIDPAIRIILITAYMDYELSDIRHRIGKDFIFLSKPVNRDELLQLTTLFSAQWERAYELTKQHKIEILSTNAIPWATEGVPQEREATDERPMQVMLVDPSVAIRNLYENLLLRNTNYDVVCAKNIAEAVKLTEHFTPDLVIVSFSLQEEGIEPLTEQVLNKSGSHESLLVFFAEKSDVKEAAFMAGAIEVLFKDDPTEIFLQRVGAFEKYIAAQKNLRSTIQNKADQYLIAAEDAQQASKAKDEFLASVSHELRTPLTVIIGNSEELLGSELSDSQRRLLHSVEVSARSQLSLINDILDISSIEAGKFKVEEAPYDLRALVDEVHDIFYSRASFAGLEFTTTIQQEFSHQLIGDGHRIGQILINLLGNAIKFTQQGEVILTVWGDNELHFRVEDSGIGISMEAQKQLFQRYEQADETISARFGGTGLGLNISYTLAEQMGGTIEVKSREGKGSCFQLNLPYRASEIKSDYSTMDKSSQLIQPSFSGRVLIAEDTPEIQLVVIRMLEAMGIEVLKANNGREAVESALSNHFDLILMDMQMPVMDGLKATWMLRKTNNKTPIVALTANMVQKNREKYSAAGCNGFLSKPIDRKQLQEVLKKYLKEESAPYASSKDDLKTSLRGEKLIDKKTMKVFIDRTKALLTELREALDADDMVQIQGTAHTVKGSGTTFGYPELTRMGKDICDAIDLGRIDTVRPMVERLIVAMESVGA